MKVHAYSHTIQGIPFWITRPKVATKKAILLFPEAFNLTGHMVDVATRFARLGFNVYVPSLYFHQGYGIKYLIHPKDKDEREQRLQGLELSQFETSFGALQEYFITKYDFLALGGFSIGGYFALALSPIFKPSRVFAFYPNPTMGNRKYRLTSLESILPHIKCPIQCFFGSLDHSIPEFEVERFKELIPHAQVNIYNAQHGYFCNSRHTYNKECANDSWEQLQEFLAFK